MTHVTANTVQESFRGRNDDGTETSATWIAAANTNWTQDTDANFRTRFLVQETAGGDANNLDLIVEFDLAGAGFTAVTGTSAIQFVTSGTVSDATATTQQVGSGTFIAGEFDDNGTVSTVSLNSEETEMEYSLTIDSGQVTDAQTFQLRVTDGGSALDGYTNTPTVTVNVPPTTQDLSPTGIATAEAFGTAVITTGSVDFSPTGIVSAEAFGTATIVIDVTPTGIAGAEAFGTSVITTGSVDLAPTGITSDEAFGSPQLNMNVFGLTGIASAEAFGTATVVAVGANLLPTGIVSAEAFGTSTITVGAVDLSPTGITSDEAFGTAAVLGLNTIVPTGITSDEAFGTQLVQNSFPQTITLAGNIASEEAFGTAQVGEVQILPTTGGLGLMLDLMN